MSIIKSISLTPDTDEIRQRIPNFSRFVRNCLREWSAMEGGHHTQRNPLDRVPSDNTGKEHWFSRCNPMHANGCCPICWPFGRPTRDSFRAWRDYCQKLLAKGTEPDASDIEFIDSALETNEHRVVGYTGPEKKPHKKAEDAVAPVRVGLIRRFARWLY